MNINLYLLTASCALGGFLFGYDTGVISGALVLIKDVDVFGLTDLQSEVVVSSTIVGAVIGSSCGGILNNYYGRRGSIMLSSVIFALGAMFMALSKNFEILVLGRIFIGFGVGISSMTVPMYIAEVSPPDLRGALVTTNNLFITFGQFTSAVIDGLYSSTQDGWRYMLGLSALPAIIQFFAFLFLPESPRYLITQHQNEKATQALRFARDTNDVSMELMDIINEVESSSPKDEKLPWFHCFSIRFLFLGCMLQAIQQFSGINTVMYYSATILQMAGFTNDSQAIWLSAGVAFSNFFFTFVGLYLVERIGRRLLTLSSLFGVGISLFCLAFGFMMAELQSIHVTGLNECDAYTTCLDCVASNTCGFCNMNGKAQCVIGNATSSLFCNSTSWSFDSCPDTNRIHGWFIFAGLFMYLAFFAPGMGPMPWVINSELYPLHTRSTAMSIATSVNWISNLLVAFTFLSLIRVLSTYGTFFFFGIIVVLSWIYFWYNLPETKGVKLEDIQNHFNPTSSSKKPSVRTTLVPYQVVSNEEE